MSIMDKRLIVTYQTSGHHVEYLHHLYVEALQDKDHEYIFAVPREFEQKKAFREWLEAEHIRFLLFDKQEANSRFVLLNAWRECRFLRSLIKQTGASWVFLITLIDFIPFLALLVPRGVEVSGILYRIYTYIWTELSPLQKIQERLKFWSMAHMSCIKRAFVLNDTDSAHRLNQEWQTTKFTYLPDPYVPLDEKLLRDMRAELGIAADKTMVLHLGSITGGKGSDRIFDMIDHSSEDELRNYCFVFAGVIAEDIKTNFYQRYNACKQKAHIILKEGFLSYEDMGSLIQTADKVVLPYRRVAQSSGIIAYCAQLGTPVYVPNKGLIGKLVKQYNIGVTVEEFRDIHSVEQECRVSASYCEEHTAQCFAQTILQ